VLATLVSRHFRLLASCLIVAVALAARSPAVDPASQPPAATIAAAPTDAQIAAGEPPGKPPPTDEPSPTGVPASPGVPATTEDPGPSGDSVTGGESGAAATAEPTAPATPTPTPPDDPQPPATPRPTSAAADAEPFAMNVYRRGDFIAQYTFEWCVGASLQMALAIVDASADRSKSRQRALWEMARDRSFSPFGGANPRGWTAALNDLGIGPYTLVSLPTFDEALRVAALAIRTTERPVGLVMWRGRHAWLMSGFESIGDPAVHADVAITGIRVLDPLHPHGSAVWGPSPEPNDLVTPEVLGRQFVLRDSTRVNLGVPPGFLLVLPTPR
jgi:hypothetical protein